MNILLKNQTPSNNPRTDTAVRFNIQASVPGTHGTLLRSPDEAEQLIKFLEENPDFRSLKSAKERKRFVARKLREWSAEEKQLQEKRAKLDETMKRGDRTTSALDEITICFDSSDLTLQRPDGSLFRDLRKAVRNDEAVYISSSLEALLPARDYEKEVFCEAEILVVEHDWSAALGAGKEEGPIKLPYDVCAFEFQINDLHVIAIATQFNEDVCFTIMVLTSFGWMVTDFTFLADARPEHKDSVGLIRALDFISRQIRAICIALDAEVATSEATREPHSGTHGTNHYAPRKPYHVVRLANRHARALPRASPASTGRRVRLHFRRGHWRHFESYKTWIKWMLVGDPDLGFVDKEYRL